MTTTPRRTAALEDLIEQVRQHADLENDPSVTDAEITRAINQALGKLHVLKVSAYGEDYFYESTELTTTPGQDYVEMSETVVTP